MTTPVILVLGAGPRIGKAVAQAFTNKGYKVVLTSRKAKSEDDTENTLNISADLSNPQGVAEVFAKVKSAVGPPSVVVYNAAGSTMNDAKDPLSLPLDTFIRDLTVNANSTFAAAQQAVLGFRELPDTASKTFIYTGNITNLNPIPGLMDLGVGKSATAHIIQSAAGAYKDQGIKFYYADERKETGAPAFGDLSGDAAGEFYAQLAESQSQGPWQQTFVKGQGYKDFSSRS